jgi:hypothetical protein
VIVLGALLLTDGEKIDRRALGRLIRLGLITVVAAPRRG